jgi:hypothetical protein
MLLSFSGVLRYDKGQARVEPLDMRIVLLCLYWSVLLFSIFRIKQLSLILISLKHKELILSYLRTPEKLNNIIVLL